MSFVQTYRQQTLDAINAIDLPLVEQAIEWFRQARADGRMIFVAGNGGSASDAQHIAAEFVGRYISDRAPLAAIALTLGMAIDANVLINERIREEVRGGQSPQAAIAAGYERAWGTILDSNVTTLIAGLALLVFGSGPVRGFAVVHCLGIITSMFSAVTVSRALVNLVYGHRRRVAKLAIGDTAWN